LRCEELLGTAVEIGEPGIIAANLFSAKLLEQWYKFTREREFLAFFTSKMSIYYSEKIRGSGGLPVDFREVQSVAETEYAELKQQYDLLVTPKHDGSNFLPNNNKL
jgi:hypothetical protein